MHHMLGDRVSDMIYTRMHHPVTIKQAVLNNPGTAPRLFDKAIFQCLTQKLQYT
jgi:TPP-dependent 2-oxoacid decarboxylase